MRCGLQCTPAPSYLALYLTLYSFSRNEPSALAHTDLAKKSRTAMSRKSGWLYNFMQKKPYCRPFFEAWAVAGSPEWEPEAAARIAEPAAASDAAAGDDIASLAASSAE
jgi:hypothetical protein